jgi:hypothetical protein
MLIRSLGKGRLVAGAVALLLAAALASPPLAAAGKFAEREARKSSCPPGNTLVDRDTKVCPPTPRRHAIVLSRACCENRGGRVKCKKFGHCPKRSPSGDDD